MRRFAVPAGVVALLAVGGVAFAQTTGDERIYACVSNGDGTMREVAGPDVVCPKNFHKLSWSSENPPAADIPTTTTYVKGRTVIMAENVVGTGAAVHCDTGDVSTGGGFRKTDDDLVIDESRPESIPGEGGTLFNPRGWEALARKASGSAIRVTRFEVYAVCQHTE